MNEQDVKKAFGKIIRNYRKSMKLTQSELGQRISINQRQVALIENGKSFPSLTTIIKLSGVFQCKIAELFTFDFIPDKNHITEDISTILNTCSYEQLTQIYSMSKIIKKL